MGSARGTRCAAAAQIGIRFSVYEENRQAGLKWCWVCRTFKALADFSTDSGRPDGLTNLCRSCCAARQRIYRGNQETEAF